MVKISLWLYLTVDFDSSLRRAVFFDPNIKFQRSWNIIFVVQRDLAIVRKQRLEGPIWKDYDGVEFKAHGVGFGNKICSNVSTTSWNFGRGVGPIPPSA